MRARQLEMLLSKFSGRTATDLDQRARRLRESRMVPSVGPGRYAPEIDASHAATMIIAAAASSKAVDAVQGVATYSPMIAVHDGFAGCKTFGEAMESILASDIVAGRILHVELMDFTDATGLSCATVSRAARVTWNDGEDVTHAALYVSEKESNRLKGKDFDPLKFGSTGMYPRMVIGGGLLQQVSLELAEEDATGYSEREAAD